MSVNGKGLQGLQTIFKSLLAGQVFFFAAMLFIKYKKDIPDSGEQVNKLLQIGVLLVSFAALIGGNKLFNKKTGLLRDAGLVFQEKFALYQKASIIKWAMTETACIGSIVSYFVTGNYAFIALAIVLMLIFSSYYPIKIKVVQQLGLNEQDQTAL